MHCDFDNSLFIFLAGALTIYLLRKYALRRRFLRQLFNARITPVQLKQKIDAGEDILILDVRRTLDIEDDPTLFLVPYTFPWNL